MSMLRQVSGGNGVSSDIGAAVGGSSLRLVDLAAEIPGWRRPADSVHQQSNEQQQTAGRESGVGRELGWFCLLYCHHLSINNLRCDIPFHRSAMIPGLHVCTVLSPFFILIYIYGHFISANTRKYVLFLLVYN